ncbi:MAG TPA: FAD-linked oxidase C-terminal domain-containing protein [Methylomirabilota bacterium]|jgi:glycolate oxidase|nr:FAD-linked oxidase C-terminal domain-containing protein [Methylomirabilota bacterium]
MSATKIQPRLVDALREVVGRDGVIAAPDDCLVYECDMLVYYKGVPDVVVLPRSVAEVLAVVRLVLDAGVPIVPRGSGTGLIGGAMAPRGGVMIGVNRMDRVLEVDLANRHAVVEPGVINLGLTRMVEGRGYFFAPDPSSQMVSSIGGNAATNAGGPHALKYGSTVNHVLGLELVTGRGELLWLGGPVRERPGYDLTGVVVGSEGTLGVITKVAVRLTRAGEAVKTALATFASIEVASQAVSAIIAEGIIPAALEAMDEPVIRAVEAGIKAGYPTDAKAVLLIELDGPAAEVEVQAEAVARICQARGALSLRVAADDKERALLWKGRKEAAGAFGRITHNYVLQDAVVPRSKLPEIMAQVQAIAQSHGVMVANVFHAGDGNLHPMICYDERVSGQFDAALAASEAILDACIAVGGTVTGEHGVGMDKAQKLARLFNADDLAAMAAVRRVFDPRLLMNPEKVFPSGAACPEVPRVGAGKPVPEGMWV